MALNLFFIWMVIFERRMCSIAIFYKKMLLFVGNLEKHNKKIHKTNLLPVKSVNLDWKRGWNE